MYRKIRGFRRFLRHEFSQKAQAGCRRYILEEVFYEKVRI